ncbi:MAG TPA: tungstate ABC transporter substrate-binding protein WtpA [Victivallales bacterium]|nr:tungstate ABC transporter substrate-binding protein WtpA [Victivallales bacterium]
MKRLKIVGIFILLITVAGYSFANTEAKTDKKEQVIVFHAGSLSVPLKIIKKAYEKKYPNVNVIMEASGSRMCARKISELHQRCDVIMSADYTVIKELLMPKYASWYIENELNQMAIVYTDKAKYSDKINSKNWYKILLKKGVISGHSNPDDDPCGYESIIVMKLASKYYGIPDLYKQIEKNSPMTRPMEMNLLALLQEGEIDYAFLYKSVAEQQKLNYVTLPDKINLGSLKYADYYKTVEIKLTGKQPGTYIIKKGAPMIYGLTIPTNAPDKKAAIQFIKFLLGKDGQKIMKECGMTPIEKAPNNTYSKIPKQLQKFALPYNYK